MRDDEGRPDRHALLELDAILRQVAALRAEGSPDRFQREPRYRWLLHRLWIAAGNEAVAYTNARGVLVHSGQPWSDLYDLRNHLAHRRLPDIDEGLVQRVTWLRLDQLRRQVRDVLR